MNQLTKKIDELFKEAYDTDTIQPVIKVYTSNAGLYEAINKDLATLVSTNNLRDIGISPDAPQNRHYWEGPLDIACVIVSHPELDRYKIKEEMIVYRGMVVSKNILDNYQVGTRLMNKTFISTSKSADIASTFSGEGSVEVS